jgi:hypothetical protein
MKAIRLLCLLSVLCSPLWGQETWTVMVDWDGQVFPSYIIATSTMDFSKLTKASDTYLGDPKGFVGVEYVPDHANARVRVDITGGEIIKSGTLEGVAARPGVKYRIFPRVVYDYRRLGRLIEPLTEDLTVTLTVDGHPKGSVVKAVRYRSVNDCPLAVLDDRGRPVQDLHWMLAAYVNENHPLIDRILAAALRNGVVKAFSGYQGTNADVYNEVFAIWNTLQRMNVRYSNITTSSGESPRVLSQHVRKFEDCVANSQANCADGSVLLASIFRKIGLHTGLVVIPGHCFVTVMLDAAGKAPIAIETTMIGNVDVNKPSLQRGINSLLSGRPNNLSRTSFDEAAKVGSVRFDSIRANFGRDMRYQLIDIETARRLGVSPLNSMLR